MVLELATVLLGACVGAVAVFYAAPRGYLGHPRKRGNSASMTYLESYTTPAEQAVVPAAVAPAAAEPAPTPAPTQAIYETVQPSPAPVNYTPPASTSFGAPTLTKKPVRTYRRRTAPVRSVAGSKVARTTKTKKR